MSCSLCRRSGIKMKLCITVLRIRIRDVFFWPLNSGSAMGNKIRDERPGHISESLEKIFGGVKIIIFFYVDPWSGIENIVYYFEQVRKRYASTGNNCLLLSSQKWLDLWSGKTYPGSKGQKNHRIPSPDPQSWLQLVAHLPNRWSRWAWAWRPSWPWTDTRHPPSSSEWSSSIGDWKKVSKLVNCGERSHIRFIVDNPSNVLCLIW